MSVKHATPEQRHNLVLAAESAAVKLAFFQANWSLKGVSDNRIAEFDAAVSELKAAVDAVYNAVEE